ncbi:MAG: hypothetical protein ACPL4K_02390 [Candidatus Margulisiibacteriota bacterium]
MIQGVTQAPRIKFTRFLPPEAPAFKKRIERLYAGLGSKLLPPHVEFAKVHRGKDWYQIVAEVAKVDLTGINLIRPLEEIIEEIDSKTEGQILDETLAHLRKRHFQIRGRDLPPDFTILDFLKSPPMVESPGEPNFDPSEILFRSFGINFMMLDVAKLYGLTREKATEFENNFKEGYLFLRSAEILSRLV